MTRLLRRVAPWITEPDEETYLLRGAPRAVAFARLVTRHDISGDGVHGAAAGHSEALPPLRGDGRSRVDPD